MARGRGQIHNITPWLRTTGLEKVTFFKNLKNILLKNQGLLSQRESFNSSVLC